MTTIHLTKQQASYLWQLGEAADRYVRSLEELKADAERAVATGTTGYLTSQFSRMGAEVETKWALFNQLATSANLVIPSDDAAMNALARGIAERTIDRWDVLHGTAADGTSTVEVSL